MPLLETLLTGLGTSVANGVLKWWLKDDPLAQAASTGTVDLLKKKLESVFDQRAAERELAKITERSARSFLEVIEKDETQLPETEIEFIANSAAAVINQTSLSAELVAKHDLDPDLLADYFLTRTGAEGGNPKLASDENPTRQGLFQRLLLTAAQQIVHISSRLPLFTESVFREILQRENCLYDTTVRVLDGMDKLVAVQQGLDPEAERYEKNFRLACIQQHNHLQLFGVDLDQSNRSYELNVAYVTLEVEKTAIDELDDDVSRQCGNDPDDDFSADDFREALPVDQALAKARRLLIRGQAGSGKTTLVQWAAVYSAGRDHTGELETCNELVPFVIKLRELEDGRLPSPDEFAKIAAPNTGGEPDRWSHRKLERGEAIVLIDGLDEAAEEQRVEVRLWLRDLLDQYPDARYVVTTRPHAVDEGWLDTDGFVDATLQDMTPRDITNFIVHWHDAVASGLDDEVERAELPALAASLQTELKKNSDLARLATSPLLCAMICALHRDRNQSLPKNRIGLYRACIEMFFRRDNERRIRNADYVALEDEQKLLLLRSLAWWMIRNEKSAIGLDEASERLERAVSELNPRPNLATGEKVTRFFIDRVALLQQVATGKINFPHRTFQEYLAALEALADGDQQLLINNAEKDQWREVVILAAGLIENKDAAEAFVLSLLLRGDKERSHRQTLYLVGAAARQNVARLPGGSKLEAETSQRLKEIIPPTSMKGAQELAKAGNLVVRLLAYDERINGSLTAASVRTLALINSPQALAALFDYVYDKRQTVRNQLNVAVAILSDEAQLEYTRRYVPAEFAHRGVTDQTADSIIRVRLGGINGLVDCSLLKNCLALQTLDLSDCPSLSDVTGIGNCQALQTLHLSFCLSLSDVSGLGNCQALQWLNLRGCTSLSNVSDLGNCKALQTLDLSGCSSLPDVSVDNLQRRLPTLTIYR